MEIHIQRKENNKALWIMDYEKLKLKEKTKSFFENI